MVKDHKTPWDVPGQRVNLTKWRILRKRREPVRRVKSCEFGKKNHQRVDANWNEAPNSGNWIECPIDVPGYMTIWEKGQKSDRQRENDRIGERSQNVRGIWNGGAVRCPRSNGELAKTDKTWQERWKWHILGKITQRLTEILLMLGEISLLKWTIGKKPFSNGENFESGKKNQ